MTDTHIPTNAQIGTFIYLQAFLGIIVTITLGTCTLERYQVVYRLIITDMRNASHLELCLYKKQPKQKTQSYHQSF